MYLPTLQQENVANDLRESLIILQGVVVSSSTAGENKDYTALANTAPQQAMLSDVNVVVVSDEQTEGGRGRGDNTTLLTHQKAFRQRSHGNSSSVNTAEDINNKNNNHHNNGDDDLEDEMKASSEDGGSSSIDVRSEGVNSEERLQFLDQSGRRPPSAKK